MEPTAKRSWWQRNWKWFVPVGCLGLVLCGVALVAAIVSIAMGAVRSSEPFQAAVARAKADPAAVEALGEPVSVGWLVTGSINVSGPSGSADFAIPLRGPRGKGTLYVVAGKEAGRWEYRVLELEVEGRTERIQLPAPP